MSTERLIPRLLARRDRLSRVEKDEILASVLAGVSPPKQRARWWLALVPAVAVTVAVVLIAPWRSPAENFGARGDGRPFAALHATCTGGCVRGEKIVFDLHGTTGYRHFAAFSKRPDGTVLWYFPSSAADSSIDLMTQPKEGVLDRSIVIGADHTAGSYRLYGVFSLAPLTRDVIRAAFDEITHSAGPDTKVVVTELVVR